MYLVKIVLEVIQIKGDNLMKKEMIKKINNEGHKKVIENWFKGVDYLILNIFDYDKLEKDDPLDLPYAILTVDEEGIAKEFNFIYIFPKYNKENEYSISVDKTLSVPYDFDLQKQNIPFVINLLNDKDDFLKNRSIK